MVATRSEYKKSEASRKQVVDAAIKTIAKRGFADSSVSDIAKTAGMSKGVVHYHFESKTELIERVLDECCRRMSTRVRRAWEEAGSPTEKIRRALREMWLARVDGSPEMRVLADLMAIGVHDPKIRKPLSVMLHGSREELVGELVKSFASMGLKPRIPANVVPRIVLATLDGLGLHQLFDPPSPEDEKEVFRALEVLAFSMFEL